MGVRVEKGEGERRGRVRKGGEKSPFKKGREKGEGE